MGHWHEISIDKDEEVYQNFPEGDVVAIFNKKDEVVQVIDGFEDSYLLDIEDLEWLTAKAKELFKVAK